MMILDQVSSSELKHYFMIIVMMYFSVISMIVATCGEHLTWNCIQKLVETEDKDFLFINMIHPLKSLLQVWTFNIFDKGLNNITHIRFVSQYNLLLKFYIPWSCHYTYKTNDIHTISPSAYWWTHNCIHKYALTILLNTRVLMILFLDSSKYHPLFISYSYSINYPYIKMFFKE